MRYHYLLTPLAVLLLNTVAVAVDPSDLKPGLIATYQSGGSSSGGSSVSRSEPTVALLLKAGEGPHPKLSGVTTAKWAGYVNITRQGKYTFSATLQNGTLGVTLGGKEVFKATGDAKGTTVNGAEVSLEGGADLRGHLHRVWLAHAG
ncbi:MAG: PA14 domain-containing protein [Gemmataceae bacterium]